MAMTLPEWPASPGFPEPLWYGVEDWHRLLLWATDQAVSDVTLQANQPVVVERHGRLFPVTRRRLAPAEVYHLTQVIYGDNAPSQLAGGQDIDCSYEIPRGRADLARYRVNMTAVRAGCARPGGSTSGSTGCSGDSAPRPRRSTPRGRRVPITPNPEKPMAQDE